MLHEAALPAPAAAGPRRLNRRVTTLVFSAALILVLGGIFLAGSVITAADVGSDFHQRSLPPSPAHPFGTDWLGRNMFLRTVKGLSLSIMVGTLASAASAVVAMILGIGAAIGGPRVDAAINWLIDLVMGIPHLVLLILISFALGGGMRGLIVGIALTHWPSLARVIRAEALQVRGQQYIAISRRLGRSPMWILRHHVLPHTVPQFIVGLVLLFPHAILHEAALSFLGFGLSPEAPAIGIILAESMRHLVSGMWWLAVFPGVALILIVVAFDKLGDNLRTLLDPSSAQK